MNELQLLFKGVLAGIAIAAPVGPVNVLCISRTIAKGRKSGLISGLGAAAADMLYGAVAGFSISFVIRFLVREEFWIRLVGGILLIGLGLRYFFKKPQSLREDRGGGEGSDFVSTFLLNLTNPTTVLSFLAVLAALGMGGSRPGWMTLFAVGGIFAGSMVWWIALIMTVNRLRDRFNDTTMLWMNRIAGLAIGAFGVLTLFLAHSAPVKPR